MPAKEKAAKFLACNEAGHPGDGTPSSLSETASGHRPAEPSEKLLLGAQKLAVLLGVGRSTI